MSESLIQSFLASVPLALRPALASMVDLEDHLVTMCDQGVERWPQLRVDREQFVAFIGSRLPPDRRADQVLAVVRAPDLYLACACADGDDVALRLFDDHFIREVDLALARMRVGQSQVDEVKQLVRQKLFVADGGRPGRIADYSGRGDLRRWVRSIAVRTCLNQMRKGKRELPMQDERIAEIMTDGSDGPEMAYMKERYRNEFRQAFLQALGELTDRQQNLLRYHHVDELNIDEIGAIYRVHRVTAYRWLEKARDALVDKTQKIMRAHLKIEKRDFESIMRLIRSQLHISLVRYLGEEPKPEGDDNRDGDGDGDGGSPGPKGKRGRRK